MAEPDDTAAVLERAYRGDDEGEGYHGPALRRLLFEVGADRARAHPVAGAHSIVEVVRHLVSWQDWIASRVEGKPIGNPEGDGWAAVDALSDAEWAADVARLDESHDRLVLAVHATDAATLDRVRDRVHFALHHGLYHAGQIGLLRKAPIGV